MKLEFLFTGENNLPRILDAEVPTLGLTLNLAVLIGIIGVAPFSVTANSILIELPTGTVAGVGVIIWTFKSGLIGFLTVIVPKPFAGLGYFGWVTTAVK